MAEYSTLKVPELKKLLAEKGLSQTGNKADLIARLTDDDNKNAAPEASATTQAPADTNEDEINYSDDEDDAAKPAAPVAAPPAEANGQAEPVPTTEEAAPAAESAAAAPEVVDDAAPADAAVEEDAAPAADAPPPTNFALGLNSTAADAEAKKRADRAKRFGIEEDDDAKKRADRASRFGIDEKSLASGLDSALPERSLKRGRGREGQEPGGRANKRQSQDRRGGGRRRGGGGGGGDRERAPRGNGPATRSGGGLMDDPAEKAKAEKRAARFAS